jgi:predicted CxxxxCH...CXXCH cytochrome family protein
MKKIFLIYTLVIVSFVVFLYGCSEVKNDLTVAAPYSGIHGTGWVDPSSANFHGKALMSTNFNFSACKQCHGGDYSGGTSKVACTTCHENGPESCNTCHGNSEHINPPKAINGNLLNTDRGVGAHVKHLNTDTTQRISAVVACTECHTGVNSFSDTNHLQNNQLRATIKFGPLANNVLPYGNVIPNPQWNKDSATCSNVYCHGAFHNGNFAAPVFNNPGSVYCGTCHGDPLTGNPRPGGSHPTFPTINECYLCHSAVINQDGSFHNESLHINGEVNFGLKK